MSVCFVSSTVSSCEFYSTVELIIVAENHLRNLKGNSCGFSICGVLNICSLNSFIDKLSIHIAYACSIQIAVEEGVNLRCRIFCSECYSHLSVVETESYRLKHSIKHASTVINLKVCRIGLINGEVVGCIIFCSISCFIGVLNIKGIVSITRIRNSDSMNITGRVYRPCGFTVQRICIKVSTGNIFCNDRELNFLSNKVVFGNGNNCSLSIGKVFALVAIAIGELVCDCLVLIFYVDNRKCGINGVSIRNVLNHLIIRTVSVLDSNYIMAIAGVVSRSRKGKCTNGLVFCIACSPSNGTIIKCSTILSHCNNNIFCIEVCFSYCERNLNVVVVEVIIFSNLTIGRCVFDIQCRSDGINNNDIAIIYLLSALILEGISSQYAEISSILSNLLSGQSNFSGKLGFISLILNRRNGCICKSFRMIDCACASLLCVAPCKGFNTSTCVISSKSYCYGRIIEAKSNNLKEGIQRSLGVLNLYVSRCAMVNNKLIFYLLHSIPTRDILIVHLQIVNAVYILVVFVCVYIASLSPCCIVKDSCELRCCKCNICTSDILHGTGNYNITCAEVVLGYSKDCLLNIAVMNIINFNNRCCLINSNGFRSIIGHLVVGFIGIGYVNNIISIAGQSKCTNPVVPGRSYCGCGATILGNLYNNIF